MEISNSSIFFELLRTFILMLLENCFNWELMTDNAQTETTVLLASWFHNFNLSGKKKALRPSFCRFQTIQLTRERPARYYRSINSQYAEKILNSKAEMML